MTKRNPENERIMRKYFIHLRRARGKSEATIDIAAAAIDRFLEMNRHKPLKRFHIGQASSFRDRFEEATNPKTGRLLSRSTVTTQLRALRDFFHWLADQAGYKSRITYTDAEYFTPSLHDERIARARRDKYVPTIEQIGAVIARMPADTVIERRNRALVAFTLIACPRDGATASVRLKHVDLEARKLAQVGAEMNTKFRKSFPTFFFPVGGNAEAIVGDWVRELREDHLFGPEDPLFPKTRTGLGRTGSFEALGLDRAPWRNTASIRKVFREAFAGAGLPCANPHSIRDALVHHGLGACKTMKELKAWSQNLGHDQLMTTLKSYGTIADREVGRLIHALGEPAQEEDKLSRIRAVLDGSGG